MKNKNPYGHNTGVAIFALICLLVIMASWGCALHRQERAQGIQEQTVSKGEKGQEKSSKEARQEKLEERIISSPMLITEDYFRQTAGSNKPISLFGNSKKEKQLEARLARLEERLKGLPQRTTDKQGMPVLRRKVVLLSLLGDLGLDVLSLLPAALRRTNGVVPVDASQLSRLLKERGETVSDLASASVRREIAAAAGIHAYILVYFPQGKPPTKGSGSPLRIDVIHATESVLIGSYLATVNQFDTVAKKISEDVIRGTAWSCRIVKVAPDGIYLNAGRLTGLRPGDRLKVFGLGQEIIDPLTGHSLGFAPGPFKGEIKVNALFGTDASKAVIISGQGFKPGDIVKISELAP